MSAFTVIHGWFSAFTNSDWLALVLFLFGIFGYRIFLFLMLRKRPDSLFLGKLQRYRAAWIDTHCGGDGSLVVVQTLRNTIMSASFLASTAVILIMGAFNLLHTLDRATDPAVVKILLVIILLTYTFLNFTWYIREINYMSYILNIPRAHLEEIEGGTATEHIARMFLDSGILFSLGMRGYYFIIPLLFWFFSPLLMITATLVILYILLRRDLAG